jgi:GH15 family glucan-1,4-alpha-glucosidase
VAQGLRTTSGLGDDASATGTEAEIMRCLIGAAGPSAILRKFIDAPGSPLSRQPTEITEQSDEAVAGHERIGRALPPDSVDGSALLVLGEFGPFEPSGDVSTHTLGAIEDALVVDGGVHRYLEDEFYGGGLWVVLGGALASALATHDASRAREVLAWVESQADPSGELPEQVPTHLRAPRSLSVWTDRWGPPAQPLLWSHAMYLLAAAAVRRADQL